MYTLIMYDRKDDMKEETQTWQKVDEAKEIAHLQRELRDTKDALEILKKAISILGK